MAQCIGVAILETVSSSTRASLVCSLLPPSTHLTSSTSTPRFVIGLTLAVSENLGPLLAVLTFHQTFEGVGLGSRLSVLPLPRKYNWGAFALPFPRRPP